MKEYIGFINDEIVYLLKEIKKESAKYIIMAKSDREIEKIKLIQLYYESALNNVKFVFLFYIQL
jgi:hypothetical protein